MRDPRCCTIKCLSTKFQTGILKLFNLVLSVGYYPDIWNQGLITPIFKSGDKFDPSNYRGICVNSNLGKLFCSIINSRVLNFLTEYNTLSKCQVGFVRDRTVTSRCFWDVATGIGGVGKIQCRRWWFGYKNIYIFIYRGDCQPQHSAHNINTCKSNR